MTYIQLLAVILWLTLGAKYFYLSLSILTGLTLLVSFLLPLVPIKARQISDEMGDEVLKIQKGTHRTFIQVSGSGVTDTIDGNKYALVACFIYCG